jgi:glutathione S-transferase
VLIAGYGVSVPGAVALVLLMLLWRWGISLSTFVAPVAVPELELETISASHFAEKVRWCMDRLGLDYTERQMAGVFGAFLLGRTIPVLKVRTGAVRSRIGNSPEILRYLWGAYGAERAELATFLEPTAERIAFEQRIDRYGVNLQVWVYHHILDDRGFTLRIWGCDNPLIPAWQRYLVRCLFPALRVFLRRAFKISDAGYRKASEHIERLLADVDARLAVNGTSILDAAGVDYVDIAFAAISGLWLQPPGYSGGRMSGGPIPREEMPAGMRADVERWIQSYPHAAQFIQRLYQEERSSEPQGQSASERSA